MQRWPLSALRKATPSNSPLLPSMHCTGNFVLEFSSINSGILKLTHARAAKICRLLHRPLLSGACATVRIGEFMLGNSRMKLPDAMHAGQERWLRRGRGLAASAAPVVHPSIRMMTTTPSQVDLLLVRSAFSTGSVSSWTVQSQRRMFFHNRRRRDIVLMRCWQRTFCVVFAGSQLSSDNFLHN